VGDMVAALDKTAVAVEDALLGEAILAFATRGEGAAAAAADKLPRPGNVKLRGSGLINQFTDVGRDLWGTRTGTWGER